MCTTGDLARRFEDAQDLVGEGPSIDALRSGEVVQTLSVDGLRTRWPLLTGAAGDLAVPGVCAIPMRPARQLVGVLTVYRDLEGPLVHPIAELQFVADTVGAAVVEDAGRERNRLTWGERDRIAQATGMVIVQLRMSAPDAAAVVRAHAFPEGVSVLEVSDRIVARELRFSSEEDA